MMNYYSMLDCHAALAMTGEVVCRHCEEHSDEAIQRR